MFDKAVDFGLLSSYIYKDTGRTIGVTTLKRLLITSMMREKRASTLLIQ